jgi:hypothetical protein
MLVEFELEALILKTLPLSPLDAEVFACERLPESSGEHLILFQRHQRFIEGRGQAIRPKVFPFLFGQRCRIDAHRLRRLDLTVNPIQAGGDQGT